MAVAILNINGDEWVNVDALIDDFVEVMASDCADDIWNSVSTLDDECVDKMIDYLIAKDRRDIALRLKTAWVKKRFGGFFHE